ncbi:ABC transporter permease [Haloarchaeobius sp. DFWS5]|uniref:ABC transporter permease n=1 Tax=Haloarchaeobius sp. DFWS5 TaxID=3446114 RepID=UPI003EBBC435
MSWQAVLRNDLRATVRSKSVWALAAVFLLAIGGLAYAIAELAEPNFDAFLEVSSIIVALLLPLVGIVVGYEAIIPERESGSIVLALSLPNSRPELVAGKLLGRASVLVGPFLVGAIGGITVLVWRYSGFDFVQYVLFVLLALVYALVFLAVATALSMALSSSRRVIGGAFGAYVALVMFWNQLVDVVVVLLFRFQPTALADLPLWAESVKFLTPRTSFVYLVAETLEIGAGVTAIDVGSQWFASPAVAMLALLAWVVVPLGLGLHRFGSAEF